VRAFDGGSPFSGLELGELARLQPSDETEIADLAV
jgi:hypothetical protein